VTIVEEFLAGLPDRRVEEGTPLPAIATPSPALTPRESEVLRLVAEGKTNREIAVLLVISEHTVINHVSSIFAKTGVENRAGAAAFAVRHGLA
jgi:DNA-binding CsgD family transcriptional regulator